LANSQMYYFYKMCGPSYKSTRYLPDLCVLRFENGEGQSVERGTSRPFQ
jgi:hypothetical protein